jgi:flagellar biosynthesis/type III secretory pathway M-ring protein FliF/YscJ
MTSELQPFINNERLVIDLDNIKFDDQSDDFKKQYHFFVEEQDRSFALKALCVIALIFFAFILFIFIYGYLQQH